MSNASRAFCELIERIGPLIVRVDGVERVGLFQFAKMIVDDVEHLAAFAEAGIVDIARPLQVANLKTVARRIIAQAERAERRAQVAGAGVDVRHARNANVRRQIGPRAELVRHHAAEARVHERGARLVAREHVVRAALVGRFAVRHRTADRDLVGDLGRLLQVLVDAHAGHVRFDAAERPAVLDRRERLRIERFLVGHSARHEDIDDALGRAFFAFVELLLGLGLLASWKKVGSERPKSADRADRQKIAAIERITWAACHGSSSRGWLKFNGDPSASN